MMDVEIFYAALGGSVATMALMLAVLRFSSRTAQIPALSVLARWRQIRSVKAHAPVVALIAMAAACFSNALGRNAMPVGSSAKLEASAVAAFSEAPGAAVEQDVAAGGRQRAIASLRDYAEKVREKRQTIAAIGSEGGTSSKEDAGAPNLPDVDTMIVRLEKRLESEPANIDGWRMLGWSYANTGKFNEAVTAYQRALALAPDNAELSAALEETKKRASEAGTAAITSDATDLPTDQKPVPNP